RVDGYEPTKEACGFHDNKCKIRVWSIYLKKYYLNGISGDRKRMVDINFIMILNDTEINIDYIKITKSKKTL
ncbi:hypothetical protein pdam_00021811, partial [Pocillopora damicornis]